MTISTADVETATQGRLSADDPETARLLEVGLAVARRYCGWHVTPVLAEDVLILDGRGGPSLRLPTLHVVELHGVIEDGVELDIADLSFSLQGRITKMDGTYWTEELGAIVVSMSHGFDSAPAWDAAVLSYIARSSMATATGGSGRETIGPFSYGAVTLEDCSAFSGEERMLFDLYRLEPHP